MHIRIIYIIIISLSGNVLCIGKKYNRYTLYRAVPVNDSHLEFFKKLTNQYDIKFWREPGMLYRPIDFVINPKDKAYFLTEAHKLGIYYTTVIEDVQRAFDRQTIMTYIRRQMSSMNWINYFRLDGIYNWLTDLTATYPTVAELQSIGLSHQNRKILALRVFLPGKPVRPIVMIEGGIHGREWISPAFVTYLIHNILISETTDDSALKEIAHAYEWYFVPVLNPDGYEYSHTDDRQWRKNRNGNGVDLNRNFAHNHGSVGVSWNSDDENYCGQTAFSEKESLAMSNFVKAAQKRLKYYFSFHSYGQYLIIPYADSPDHTDNYEEVYAMCKAASEKMFARFNTKYEPGTAYETVGYKASGLSACWTKTTFNVPYVVTFELRDQGAIGFALPSEQILPTCQETLDGVMSLLKPKKHDDSNWPRTASGQPYKIMDQIVILFNVLLFIIARVD